MSIFKQQVNCSSILHHCSLSWHMITPLEILSSYIFCFGQKDPIKVPIFNTFECSGQNLPNSSRHFPNHKSVFLQILHHSSVSWKITPLYFVSSNNIYFVQKEPIKVKFFWDFQVLRSKFVKFLMSILKQQVDSSPNFVSLFSVMKDNSSVLC